MGGHTTSEGKKPSRILIVDDHSIVREGLRSIFSREADLEVCGEAESAPEAIQRAGECHPDLMMIDLSLKGGTGLDLVKQVKHFDNDMRMLVCSVHDEAIYAERVIRAGAHGYVRKDSSAADILRAVRKVLAGDIYLSDEATARVLHRVAGRQELDGPVADKLTDRELEVVQLIGQGKTTRQIAKMLNLSIKTIETHRESLKRKLNLHSSTELSYWAVQWANETEGPVTGS